jgi:membrane fusion protein, multidrug efflux system
VARSSLLTSLQHLWRRTMRYYKLFKTPIKWFTLLIVLAIGYKLIPVIILSNRGQPTVAVTVDTVQEEEWDEEIKSIGTVTAVQAVTISPEVGGTVVKVHVESGGKVTQGEKLISLNDEAEQAELRRYKSQLDMSKLTLERSKKLSNRKVESAADYDQKKAKVDEMEALVAQASALINKKNITAPFTGTLGIRQINVGDYVQPGTPLVTLTNSDKLFINFNLPERYATVIRPGHKIVFTVDAYPEEEFQGVITTIDPQIAQDLRNLSVQASADNHNDQLRDGMYATIRVILPQEAKTLTIPESAIDYGLYGRSVYVVDKDKNDELIVRKQFVKTGEHRHGKVAVTEGIQAGEQVVTTGQLKLNQGARISISEDKGPPLPKILPKP